MLRGPLGRQQLSNMRVYVGTEHPHEAQAPETLDVAAMNAKNEGLNMSETNLENLDTALAEDGVVVEPTAPAEPQIDAQGRAYATGKRKCHRTRLD